MINKEKLSHVLAAYRRDFNEIESDGNNTHWKNEMYKWKAVKHFQDHWNIDADDFAAMFKEATAKCFNLLDSRNYFPRRMIVKFAEADKEAVRTMFRKLFYEGSSVVDRVNQFIEEAENIRSAYGQDKWQSHYQNVNSVSTYLWLNFPDKYYIYKYSEVKIASAVLESDFKVQKGAKAEALLGFIKFYDEIAAYLAKDTETTSLLHEAITPECYEDPKYRTLTIDVGFYISRYYMQDQSASADEAEFDDTDSGLYSEDWFPTLDEYSPGFSKDQWLKLLNDKTIIGPVFGGVLAAFYAVGGAATCTQIAQKYNKKPSGISGNCTQLAKRIYKETQCPLALRKDGSKSYWPILFQGKNASTDMAGVFIWKLRPELFEALTEFDIMRYQWKTEESKRENDGSTQYWWLNANPKIWSLADIAVGEQQAYTLFNENGNKRRIFQNFLDAKEGDMVIGYESTPIKQVVAIAKIGKEQDGQEIAFEKIEGLSSPIDYQTLKECPELENMEYFRQPQGSLFRLTKDEFDLIMDIIREENPLSGKTERTDKYTKEDFLSDVYMSEEQYESLVSLLKNKSNIILQGAPGVGKTFAAKRLAWSLMGEKDESRIEFVQFHQNYSYEDFMMGYKPTETGFELKYGVFYQFCLLAANRPEKDFFFIIDEINRGNMSKVFGELLMLIEKDYRGTKTTLAYNGMPFSVPKNLYIIGMMNTADRSLALIDYALRRRFSFFTIDPGFDSQGFKVYQASLNNEKLNRIIDEVKKLNKEIEEDRSLGRGFCIGHSYFCGHKPEDGDGWIKEIVDYDLIPMLNEYWFDDTDKVDKWADSLNGVLNG